MLARLSAHGVQQFVDSVTFGESAVDNIPVENRVEIANRGLKFARQQDAALKKKGTTETQEERFCLSFASQYFTVLFLLTGSVLQSLFFSWIMITFVFICSPKQ